MPTQHDPSAGLPDPEQGGRLDARRGLDSLRDGHPGEEADLSIYDFLKNDFRFEARQDEKNIIRQIEEHIEKFAGPLFEESDRVLEEFYSSVRTADPETGEAKDDWSLLTGQDAESAVWGLQRVITELGRNVTRLYMQAQFAYNVWDDAYYENYSAPIEGTVNDRIAYARRHTKDARYYYLFTYYYWKIVNNRYKQLIHTKQAIEFSSQRQMRRENQQQRPFRYD